MKLKKIEITNFRCFETISVPLQSDINVFVGINGAGKTTILDAIAIALYDVIAANGGGGSRQRANQSITLRPNDIHVATGEDPLIRRRDFVQVRAQAGDYYELPNFPGTTTAGEPRLIDWTDYIQYLPPNNFSYGNSKSKPLNDIYRYFTDLWQEERRSDTKALIPFPVVAYYRANRRFSQMPKMGDVFSSRVERSGAFHNALNAGADYQAMCQWFYLRENQELRQQKRQHQNDINFEFSDLKAMRHALKTTLGEVGNVFFDDNPPSLKVELNKGEERTQVLELDQLSDGYRNLIALILDFARRLAQAHPNWDNPLEAPGILLIDEIELHLHPGWQQSILPDLRLVFPGTQLIVSTHSPQVLTTVKKEQVHFLTSQHRFEALPEDVGTYGSESSFVLENVFGVHTRPKNIETVGALREYLQLVESRQHTTPEALALRSKLESNLGSSDVDLVHADMRIRQLEILSKR